MNRLRRTSLFLASWLFLFSAPGLAEPCDSGDGETATAEVFATEECGGDFCPDSEGAEQ